MFFEAWRLRRCVRSVSLWYAVRATCVHFLRDRLRCLSRSRDNRRAREISWATHHVFGFDNPAFPQMRRNTELDYACTARGYHTSLGLDSTPTHSPLYRRRGSPLSRKRITPLHDSHSLAHLKNAALRDVFLVIRPSRVRPVASRAGVVTRRFKIILLGEALWSSFGRSRADRIFGPGEG